MYGDRDEFCSFSFTVIVLLKCKRRKKKEWQSFQQFIVKIHLNEKKQHILLHLSLLLLFLIKQTQKEKN